MTLDEAIQLGLSHHRRGEIAEAKRIYEQIVAQVPAHADALHLLAATCHQLGDNAAAELHARRAIELNPGAAHYHNTLGMILTALRQFEPAMDALNAAIRLNTNLAEAHCNLGNILQAVDRFDDAAAAYRAALAINPNFDQAMNNLGNTLRLSGELDEAMKLLRRALSINPNSAMAHTNLGAALADQRDFSGAIAEHRRAIQLAPNFVQAQFNLGNALAHHRQHDDAIDAYQRTLQLDPNALPARANLANALKETGQLDAAIAQYREVVTADPSDRIVHGNFLYAMQLSDRFDDAALQAEHRLWNDRHAMPLAPADPKYPNDASPSRRLRIGYVSADFREHSIARFMLPLLANHNPTIVETFCYSGASSPDEYTRRVELLAHHWRTTARLSDEQLAQLIRDDQIDILIDLSLHSAGNRLAVFARRPAPVQGTYLAYCSTSGMDAIDFRITDIHLDPHGHSATFYSEASERLPGCYWCYAPDEPSLDVSELPATKNGFITFGSLNNFSKIGPVALDAFAATLRGVPNSRLLLHAPPGRTRVRVAQHFAKHQVDPNRVEFVNYLKMDDYFAVYQRIDMALDPFPCGGGTTSCDALWMGVPIITLAGRRGMERSGVTILKNLALEQCIATDSHDYARRAMALAGDLPALAELRSGLRARMKASPIMNAAAFARAIELIYRLQWTNWCDRVRQD